jgi:hypothetical protein
LMGPPTHLSNSQTKCLFLSARSQRLWACAAPELSGAAWHSDKKGTQSCRWIFFWSVRDAEEQFGMFGEGCSSRGKK